MMPASAVGGAIELSLTAALALSAVLLTLSFVFSGTETALFSLQKLQRQRLEGHGSAGQQVNRLLQRRTALITTLLIGNETVNIAFASTGAALFDDMTPYPWLNPWLNILVVTPVLVLLSEITPKVLAFRFNAGWALASVWPLTTFYWLVAPLRLLVSGIVALLARALGVTATPQDDGLDEAELLTLLVQGEKAGNVEGREREIIEAVFDFDDLTVGRLMTPRPEMFSLSVHTPWHQLLSACREQGFSRVPIYDEDPEDIVGVLLLKDVLKHREAPPEGPLQLRSLLLPPSFVPQSKPAQDMLRNFLERKTHIGFVVDEHGTLVGLVTLDDLLGELFGEFLDDDEDEDNGVQVVSPGVFVVDAGLDLEDCSDLVGVELPEGDYHTVGGFVFHALGRLPHRGDALTWEGNRFVVRRMEGRRIAEVLLRTRAAGQKNAEVAS